MDITISPSALRGELHIIPSKSQAHRLLICAAFADQSTVLLCPDTNLDIEATADCLRALGAEITKDPDGYHIKPITVLPKNAVLDCSESGSTLRFMLPIVGALGVDTVFQMAGRLPQRPLSPLWEEMERMGCTLSRPTEDTVACTGKLVSGTYRISGGISSQFITGLLFALSLLDGESHLEITGKLESAPYVDMTLQALKRFGADVSRDHIPGKQKLRSPGTICVEGDWSNAAFFLAANALGSEITIQGLCADSVQGDRAAAELIPVLEENITVSAADIPDLVPILAVVAGAKKGAVFTDIRRLRLKESDRVATVIALLAALGGRAEADENTLTVYSTGYHGGTVDAAGDHRIAMAAAIAATAATAPVTVLGAQCTEKSYPKFWAEFKRLGGQI